MAEYADDELVHDHIARIVKLEETVKTHSDAISSLSKMENHLKAIKWVCCGMALLYVGQKFGVEVLLKEVTKFM